MYIILQQERDSVVVAPNDMTELVRGNEQPLIDCVAPLVREKNVTVDLRDVERIDAAGIAALIRLYGCARDAGRVFAVCNVTAHVREILTLVGLEPILMSHDAVYTSQSDSRFAMSAA